jgi:hypothetical protein
MAYFNSYLTCSFSFLSQSISWDTICKIPEVVIREAEVHIGRDIIAWQEVFKISFDETPWHGPISDIYLKPTCALAWAESGDANRNLVATISSMPDLVTSFNSTLPEVLSFIRDNSETVAPGVIRLAGFLAKQVEDRPDGFRLWSYTIIREGQQETHRAIGNGSLSDSFVKWADEREQVALFEALPKPEEGNDEEEWHEPAPARDGLYSIDFSWNNTFYQMQHSTVQLSNSFASLEQLSNDFLQLTELIGGFIIPLPDGYKI